MPPNGNGMRNWEDVDVRRRDFFVYTASVAALAVAASSNVTINIEADSDFILQKLTYKSDIAGAAQTSGTQIVPNVTVQLTDTGSGRQLMSNPVAIPAIFGSGELPFILPNPRLFRKNTTIQVAFTSFEAAITPDVDLFFIGYKKYGA